MFDLMHQLAQKQLRELQPGIRLIVLHPNYTPRHQLIQTLLNENACLYLCLEGDALSVEQLVTQFESALTEQLSGGDLSTIAYLILDECDRAQSDELGNFLKQMLDRLTNGRVVIVSRILPACIQDTAELRQQASLIPVDKESMLPDYAQQEDGMSLLEVRALGGGRVLLNGRLVTNWDGTLPRALFFYLIDRGMTTRNEIFETFWPTLTIREATNVFHVTKRKISEVLGVDLTYYWSGFYRISPQIELRYDVATFSELIQDSDVATDDESARLLTRATWLYRDHFLTTMDSSMPWLQRRRQELNQTYVDALIALGKLLERQGKQREALGLYVRASAYNPRREDLAGSIMTLYRDLGMAKDALETYQRLESTILETVGISPAQWLQDLAASIREQAVVFP
ncbi:MAG: bacterial transcriptional activator domain-containing protein [Anaerolineae bacterium]|nr:bacterial transcriptional activator domain-containing protein [Anaerolineae bacterium]